MKISIWDVLTTLVVIGIVITLGMVLLLFINPALPFNPFPPAGGGLAGLFIPSATPTPRRLPPTWTPTARPTEAPSPTRRPTSTPIPSITPFVLPSPTMAAKTVYPTNERLPLEGKCKVVNQSPSDGTAFKPGDIFTTAWSIQNTSDTNWGTDGIDVRFRGGDAIHTSGKNVIDLPKTVIPGDIYDITIQMKAPDRPGYHITYWALMEGNTPRCTFYVEIFVENP
jgi:hypothetical protein